MKHSIIPPHPPLAKGGRGDFQVKQIRICGLGGQGIVLMGVILGQAGALDKLYVAQSSSYGAESRGSACKSEVVLSGHWIEYPFAIEPHILIAMTQQGYSNYIDEVVKKDGITLLDSDLVIPKKERKVKHYAIPATRSALEFLDNKTVANIIMLGATVEITKLVTKESAKKAVEMTVSEKYLSLNLDALEMGFQLGRNVKSI